jgi:glutathione synthase/RimK-type ligase-like ATP-grasp enzyme
MLLFLSNSKDATCDFFCKVAEANHVNHVRLDTDFFPDMIIIEFSFKHNIRIKYKDIIIRPKDIHCVWNRRPEKIYAGNFEHSAFADHYRNEWRHSFDGFFKQIHTKKWINHPYNNANAISKIEQLIRAKKYGLSVPDTIVTQDYNKFKKFFKKHTYGIITKPLSHGYICDENIVYNIYTNDIIIDKCDFTHLSSCPTLFQEKINKINDIRINYIDGVMEATEIIFLENGRQRLDIRKNNMDGVHYKSIQLPEKIANILNRLIKSYNLRFAAIDMCVQANGEWIFFEINPNGQWAWLDIMGVSKFHEKLLAQMVQ